jgi:hypothetical protein
LPSGRAPERTVRKMTSGFIPPAKQFALRAQVLRS